MPQVEVTMPKMGESITEGTVVEWYKRPGDSVALDEPLLEIGTDKVDTDVPSPDAGTVAEILVAEGETVDVGTIIALIDTDGSVDPDPAGTSSDDEMDKVAVAPKDAAAPVVPVDADRETADRSGAGSQASEGNGSVTETGGDTVQVVMPKMGESITEGTIVTWYKAVGDTVSLDEPLLEIATDKVDTEVPSPAAGILQEILVPEGETADVLVPIAVIAIGDNEAGGDDSVAIKKDPSGGPSKAGGSDVGGTAAPHAESGSHILESTSTAKAVSKDTSRPARTDGQGRVCSPLVRSIAAQEGIGSAELAAIQGSGRDGRITKKDIVAYVAGRGAARPKAKHPKRNVLSPASPAPAGHPDQRVEIVEMDRMRQLIAEHMIRSKATSAHVTSFGEADVTNLVRLRERNRDAFFEREGVKLTYTPFFVYAAVEALREHAILNATLVENAIHYLKDYHVGIAVAIGKTGLVVPVIHDAGQKNLVGLAHAAADLADRARTKRLLPDELQGGTFTVTNVGSLGSIMGTPIINQPQVGILATGVIKKRPIVVEDPVMGDTIGVRQMMYVSLSYDHRIVDGAMGSSFLQKFIDVVESFNPDELIK